MLSVVIVALVLLFLFKILNVNSSPEKSLFFCANKKLLEEILKNTPSLSEPYFPTRLWGFSGHVQTVIQGVVSRFHTPLTTGKRYFFNQPDGTTVTYDLYHPIEQHTLSGDYTLLLCPGICNTSESVYIQRVVFQAQMQGYRVAVLNHVGALSSVPLRGNRMFTYGNTGDYDGMVHHVAGRFPGSKLLLVGFSMGANIVTKYLGEKKPKPANVIAGISACQGYDAQKAANLMLQWENFRRLYLFAMTENMRMLLRRWKDDLFTEEIKVGKGVNEREALAGSTLIEIDEAYTRKVEGYDSLEDLYRGSSCVHYLDGVKVPMIFINSTDDPVVPPALTNIIKEAVNTHDNFLYIEQKFGGHLGFYEGGIVFPNHISWLDRVVVNLADSLSIYTDLGKEKADALASDMDSVIESLSITKGVIPFTRSLPTSEDEDASDSSSEPSTPKLVVKARPGSAGSGSLRRRVGFKCNTMTRTRSVKLVPKSPKKGGNVEAAF